MGRRHDVAQAALIFLTLRSITMQLSDLAATVQTVADQLDRVQVNVAALQASMANVEVPADAQAALDRVIASAAALEAAVPAA